MIRVMQIYIFSLTLSRRPQGRLLILDLSDTHTKRDILRKDLVVYLGLRFNTHFTAWPYNKRFLFYMLVSIICMPIFSTHLHTNTVSSYWPVITMMFRASCYIEFAT